jgi:threonine synthase
MNHSTLTAKQRCIEPNCSTDFGLGQRLYTCTKCGGLLEIVYAGPERFDAVELREVWRARRSSGDPRDRSGVWRFRELLPFSEDAPVVSLFEGNTPLYRANRAATYAGAHNLWLKHQGANPTGSFKDTGMTAAVTQALILGAKTVVCASTGNTSASLAAYAARAELQCAILVPGGQVSHGKLAQSLDYGAQVLELEGNFDDCMRVIRELAEDPSIYLVNSINPFRIEGQKTVAIELAEQLNWQVPDHVVMPGGNLGNSSAFGKGFAELFALGLIDRLPKLSVVQAAGAAPFAALAPEGRVDSLTDVDGIPDDLLNPVTDPKTLATAIKIGAPVSWKKSLRAVADSGGRILSVTEQEIADSKAVIGRDGIGCEPASATTVAGIKKLTADGFIGADETVVAILTGHVLKDADYVIRYHSGALEAPADGNPELLNSSFANPPSRVAADASAILEKLRSKV